MENSITWKIKQAIILKKYPQKYDIDVIENFLSEKLEDGSWTIEEANARREGMLNRLKDRIVIARSVNKGMAKSMGKIPFIAYSLTKEKK